MSTDQSPLLIIKVSEQSRGGYHEASGAAGGAQQFANAIDYAVDLRAAGLKSPWLAMVAMQANSPAKALARMQRTAALNPYVKRPVLRLIVSFRRGIRPRRERCLRIVTRILDRLEFTGHQVLVAAHDDRPHFHLHLVINIVHPRTHKAAPGRSNWLAEAAGRTAAEVSREFEAEFQDLESAPDLVAEEWEEPKAKDRPLLASAREPFPTLDLEPLHRLCEGLQADRAVLYRATDRSPEYLATLSPKEILGSKGLLTQAAARGRQMLVAIVAAGRRFLPVQGMNAAQVQGFQRACQPAAIVATATGYYALVAVAAEAKADPDEESAAARQLTRELQAAYAPQCGALASVAPIPAPGFPEPGRGSGNTSLTLVENCVCQCSSQRLWYLIKEGTNRKDRAEPEPDIISAMWRDWEAVGPPQDWAAAVFQAHLKDMAERSVARSLTLSELAHYLGQRLRDGGCDQQQIEQILTAGLKLLNSYDAFLRNPAKLAAAIASWLVSAAGMTAQPPHAEMKTQWSELTSSAAKGFSIASEASRRATDILTR